MLAMTSVMVDYMFKNAFLTFYILYRWGPPNVAGPGVTYPFGLYSPFRQEWVR